MKTLIEGGWVVAYNGRTHEVHERGSVVIEDDKILHAGGPYRGAVEAVLEATGRDHVAGWFIGLVGFDAAVLADMRDRLQIALVKFQRGGLHLLFEVIRQLPVDLAFDRLARLAVGHAEKPLEYLFRRDRIAVTRQRLRMRAA